MSPEPRYAYVLFEITRTVPHTLGGGSDLVERKELGPDIDDHHACAERLRPWALDRLVAHGREFGLYYAGYGTLDEDGELGRELAWLFVPWGGGQILDSELVTAPAARSE